MVSKERLGICLLVLLGWDQVAYGRTDQRLQEKTNVGIGLQVAQGLHQFHRSLSFQVFFISDQFFRGLHERKRSNGLEFTKDNTTYQNFPQRLTVHVKILILKCPPSNLDQIYPLGYGEGLMADPVFELNWTGARGDLRPATLTSATIQHSIVGTRWDYFLETSCKDEPLTDSLVRDISLRKGKTHIQFTASLAP